MAMDTSHHVPRGLYGRLKHNEIRLVRLKKSALENWFECLLISKTLESSALEYMALSYVWGSSKLSCSIRIQGKDHPITANLFNALQSLWKHYGQSMFWIDALCINQNDHSERSQQVSLMKRIYESATETVVYIGEATKLHDVREPMANLSPFIFTCGSADLNMLRDFVLRFPTPPYPQENRLTILDIFCFIRTLADSSLCCTVTSLYSARRAQMIEQLFEGLRQVMRSPWWRRVWTLQEVVVAKNVTIIYGPCRAPWSMFVKATAGLKSPEITNLKLRMELSPEHGRVEEFLTNSVNDIQELRSRWQDGNGTTLLELLRKFSFRGATDPRDKVYALLSLAEPVPLLYPDYRLDVNEVFQRIILEILHTENSLNVLAGNMGRKNLQGLPSWIPDWSIAVDEDDQSRLRTLALYTTSLSLKVLTFEGHEPRPSYNLSGATLSLAIHRGSALYVEATSVARVRAVADTCIYNASLDMYSTPADIIKEWYGFYQSHSQVLNKKSFNERGTLLLRFAETICASVGYVTPSAYRRVAWTDLISIGNWLQKHYEFTVPIESVPNGSSSQDMPETIDVELSIRKATRNRAFFVTEEGSMGLGPASTCAGQSIYVIKGASVPFLVENCKILAYGDVPYIYSREEYVSPKPGPPSRMIGDCYLEGVMDGQLVGSMVKSCRYPEGMVPTSWVMLE